MCDPVVVFAGFAFNVVFVVAEGVPHMASSDDKNLGSNRAITRRDFVNGVALGVGGALTSRGLPDGTPKPRGWLVRRSRERRL